MNFTEYEQKLLDTKPRFLSDEEKVIRKKFIKQICYQKNKEKNIEKSKENYQKNKDKISKKKKEYQQTPKGKKAKIKNTWKTRGLKMENFEQIYKRYCKTTNCDNCGVKLTKIGKNNTFKVMDHDHQTGEFRNVLCHLCNMRRR